MRELSLEDGKDGLSQAAAVVGDPLLALVFEYRKEIKKFSGSGPEEDGLADLRAEITYLIPQRTILAWTRPAGSWRSAIEALRLANELLEEGDADVAQPLLAAALAYFDSRGRS